VLTSQPDGILASYQPDLAGLVAGPHRAAVTERIYSYSCVVVAIAATIALITRLARLTGPTGRCSARCWSPSRRLTG
jgi:hypothetical protein